jgi:hypothetical protein
MASFGDARLNHQLWCCGAGFVREIPRPCDGKEEITDSPDTRFGRTSLGLLIAGVALLILLDFEN